MSSKTAYEYGYDHGKRNSYANWFKYGTKEHANYDSGYQKAKEDHLDNLADHEYDKRR